MKHRVHISFILARACVLLVTGAASVAAQGSTTANADELYQQALTRERAAGDLQGAIQLYRQVAASANRVLAARALVRLGEAYEKLGANEAQSAYERIVREFADQPEPLSVARSRLEVLRAGTAPVRPNAAPALTMVFSDLPPLRVRDNPQFDFSPAGDQIVFRQPPSSDDPLEGLALAVANSGGTVVRTLVPSEKEMGRSSPRWSPDGRYVAYAQRSFIGADTSFAALMVVPAAGGSPRVLTSNIPLGNPAQGGLLWTPDSRAVTAWSAQQLITVDLDGQIVRKVRLPIGHLGQVTGYSPDGRWLVFHRINEGSEQHDEVDVWLTASDGETKIQLTDAPGFDGWATWGADGRSVYFVSDRSGSPNVWRLEVDPRSGQARGHAVQVTSYTDARILYPRVVNGGKGLAFALVREASIIQVASTAAPSATRPVARGLYPQLSPDGHTIYYEGQGAEQSGIFAIPIDGGTPRRLTAEKPGGGFSKPFSLSNDGRHVAFFTGIGSQNVLFTVGTVDGARRELTRFESREHLVPAWSPDGTRLAYVRGEGLHVINAAGGRPTRIAQLAGWDGWSVRWSPDGAYIAAFGWTQQPPSGEQNAVYVVPAAGGELRRLTPPEEPGYKEGLEWHPDSRRLTYMYYGHDGRRDETRVAYLDGRATTLLLDQPYPIWDYVGLWHPQGRDYYFIAARRGSWGLYAHDLETEASRQVWFDREVSPGAGMPAFSGDGETLVWTIGRTTRQLWTVELGR